MPGKEGLVHISELADFRVRRTEDVVKMGEMIWVKCVGIDERTGKVRLSRKAAMQEMEAKKPEGRRARRTARRLLENEPLSCVSWSPMTTGSTASFSTS